VQALYRDKVMIELYQQSSIIAGIGGALAVLGLGLQFTMFHQETDLVIKGVELRTTIKACSFCSCITILAIDFSP
jgi:hypothetical protein